MSVVGRCEIEDSFWNPAMPETIGSAFGIQPNRLHRSQCRRDLRSYLIRCPRQLESGLKSIDRYGLSAQPRDGISG